MTERLDPITFEVIKHRLWQINDEQGIAIKTISASPIVVEGNDFNVGLFTADGDVVTVGSGSVVHVTTMGDVVRSVIERAPDAADGDMYLTNDPFLGALHQNDVVIAAPLFHDGERLMWIGNVLHHPDVGGVDEGSFCINARTIYQDPPRYFLKIVSDGEISTEVEHTFVTNSRLPDMVALDLRAQIGAINTARTRLQELIDERGAELIRQVMAQSIDTAEAQLKDAIGSLPQGRWTGHVYMDGPRVGSDEILEVKLALTREGDTLHFDYTGSSPQVDAAVNSTLQATVAGTAVPLFSFLCQGDIDWNEAVRRRIRVTAPERSVVNASFPAPVSISTVGFRWLVTDVATQAIAKMFGASSRYRDRVCPSWNVSANGANLFAWMPDGRRVGALLSDHRGSGAAARSFADGFDHAGTVTSYAASIGNVEGTEWKLPVLYAYRRKLPDSGGPGMFRGGLTSEAALTPYGVDELLFKTTNTAGTDQSNAHGIDGGYPGAGSHVAVIRDTQVWDRIGDGDPPRGHADFGGSVDYIPSKADGTLKPGDVYVLFAAGGGGYGDPLDRPAEAVARDVSDGRVTPDAAQRHYGVVVGADGPDGVDDTATERCRTDILDARRDGAPTDWTPPERWLLGPDRDGLPLRVGENMECIAGPDGGHLRCRKCAHVLTGETGSAIVRHRPLSDAGPWFALRWDGDSPNFRLEEVICPGCATLLSVREVRTTEIEAAEPDISVVDDVADPVKDAI